MMANVNFEGTCLYVIHVHLVSFAWVFELTFPPRFWRCVWRRQIPQMQHTIFATRDHAPRQVINQE